MGFRVTLGEEEAKNKIRELKYNIDEIRVFIEKYLINGDFE